MLAGRHRALAEIDLEAIRHNVRRLMRDLPAGAVHCAVVKANGYRQGAVPAALAALEAGATWLGVAAVAEAEELRAAGLKAPILIFGPMTGAELDAAVAADADVVVWSAPFLAAARRLGARVHVKFDSGMGRLGVTEEEARVLCAGAAEDGLLIGLITHFGMIRTGIAMYGLAASNDDPFKDDLRPAMKLCSYVAGVRVVAPGDSVGYGRRFVADEPARIGIVPVGYADGVSRLLASRGDVLVAGRRCRITGTISMDQLTVRLPDDWGRPGDEVVFFGAAGDGVEGRAGEAWTGAAGPRRDAPDAPRILCEEVAHLLQTINYEVACDVAPRVVRRYRGAGPAA